LEVKVPVKRAQISSAYALPRFKRGRSSIRVNIVIGWAETLAEIPVSMALPPAVAHLEALGEPAP
jgi:hypothetical protein